MDLSIVFEAFNLIRIMPSPALAVYIYSSFGFPDMVNEARLNFIINELFVLCEFK